MNSEQSTITTVHERIHELAEEAIVGTSLYLVEVVVRGRKGSQVVEVYIDGDDGVGIEQLAEVSRALGFAIEAEDLIRGKYHLNVSSPGADRPLKHPRQYRQHVGRTLKVAFATAPEADVQHAEGTLSVVDDKGIGLTAARDEVLTIAFANIHEARVVLPW